MWPKVGTLILISFAPATRWLSGTMHKVSTRYYIPTFSVEDSDEADGCGEQVAAG